MPRVTQDAGDFHNFLTFAAKILVNFSFRSLFAYWVMPSHYHNGNWFSHSPPLVCSYKILRPCLELAPQNEKHQNSAKTRCVICMYVCISTADSPPTINILSNHITISNFRLTICVKYNLLMISFAKYVRDTFWFATQYVLLLPMWYGENAICNVEQTTDIYGEVHQFFLNSLLRECALIFRSGKCAVVKYCSLPRLQ